MGCLRCCRELGRLLPQWFQRLTFKHSHLVDMLTTGTVAAFATDRQLVNLHMVRIALLSLQNSHVAEQALVIDFASELEMRGEIVPGRHVVLASRHVVTQGNLNERIAIDEQIALGQCPAADDITDCRVRDGESMFQAVKGLPSQMMQLIPVNRDFVQLATCFMGQCRQGSLFPQVGTAKRMTMVGCLEPVVMLLVAASTRL